MNKIYKSVIVGVFCSIVAGGVADRVYGQLAGQGWPAAGTQSELQVCSNGGTQTFRGECRGSTYFLFQVAPGHWDTGGTVDVLHAAVENSPLCTPPVPQPPVTPPPAPVTSSPPPVIVTPPPPVTPPPTSCSIGLGWACASAPNNCGRDSLGSIQCDGSCSAITPPNEVCSVVTPPTIPPPTGGMCGSSVNTCVIGSVLDVADSSTSYLWSCLGLAGGGSTSCSASFPLPTATLQVRVNGGAWTTAAQLIEQTDTINLQWGSTNASRCDGANFTTAEAVSGMTTNVTEPESGTTKLYSVTCPGATGTSPATASVRVTTRSNNPTLVPNDIIVPPGSTTIIGYDLNNNASCTFSTTDGEINGDVVTTNGSKTTGAIYAKTTYTLNCGGGNTASVTINVEDEIRER